MQLQLGIENQEKSKVTKEVKGVLTTRDIDICKFLLEMKFASVDEVHSKFFKITLLGQESKSSRAAWKRLHILEELGLIKSLHHFKFLKRFYVPTTKALYLAQNKYSNLILPYPSKGIDIRTFEHDLKVMESRILIENSKKGFNWLSDKTLKCMNEFTSLKTANLVPDGIFTDPRGKKVCFEYEKAIKAKSRYREKIKAYVSVIRSMNNSQKLFDSVLYICENKQVKDFLQKETRIYGELFRIESSECFFRKEVQ